MSKTKTVDLVERSLEKDKKDFITMCKVLEIVSIVLFALCIMGAVLIGVVIIFSATGITEDVTESPSPAELIVGLTNLTFMLTAIIASSFSIKIFNKLKDGETPFRYDIADKIKGAGTVLTVGCLLCAIADFVCEMLVDSGVFTASIAFERHLDFGGYCIFGAIIMALAYIFNYGCKLQQESDETL